MCIRDSPKSVEIGVALLIPEANEVGLLLLQLVAPVGGKPGGVLIPPPLPQGEASVVAKYTAGAFLSRS
eukprot:11669010-Alexandrium_andersonii.AAC.1